MSDVVVTGLGVVGPFGVGREALAEALAAGRTQTVEVAPRGACRAGAADRAARRNDPGAEFAGAGMRLASAVRAYLEIVRTLDELPPPGEGEFTPAVALALGNLPGSAALSLMLLVVCIIAAIIVISTFTGMIALSL